MKQDLLSTPVGEDSSHNSSNDQASINMLFPDKRKSTWIQFLCTIIILPIFILIYIIILFLILLCLFITTITYIGPTIESMKSKRDEKLLDRESILAKNSNMLLLEVPGDINAASMNQPYKLMVRLTKPTTNSTKPPVIFPGGLAANLTAMAKHQDMLTDRGFIVVNFDRFGVGFSDKNCSGVPPSARDVAREMDYVMRNVPLYDNSEDAKLEVQSVKWISVGGSMGSTVTQAFMALFPDRLCGFLNLDGFPHGFVQYESAKFLGTNAGIWRQFSKIVWTGFMRFLFTSMSADILKKMKTRSFGPEILALMCRKRFFGNAALEFFTMFSVADLATAAWGDQATPRLDPTLLWTLCCVKPDRNVLVDESMDIPCTDTDERSASELGECYLSRDSDSVCTQLDRLRMRAPLSAESINKKDTNCNWPAHPVGSLIGGISPEDIVYPLGPQFAQMVVRVMSMRSYDLGDDGMFGEWAYPQASRNHAAAEHCMHALLARDGARSVYPRLKHTNGFAQATEVVQLVEEITHAVETAVTV